MLPFIRLTLPLLWIQCLATYTVPLYERAATALNSSKVVKGTLLLSSSKTAQHAAKDRLYSRASWREESSLVSVKKTTYKGELFVTCHPLSCFLRYGAS